MKLSPKKPFYYTQLNTFTHLDSLFQVHIDSYSWKMSSADASLTAKIDGEPAQIKQSGLYEFTTRSLGVF